MDASEVVEIVAEIPVVDGGSDSIIQTIQGWVQVVPGEEYTIGVVLVIVGILVIVFRKKIKSLLIKA